VELQATGEAEARALESPVVVDVRQAGRPLTTVTAHGGRFDEWVEAEGPVELVFPPLVVDNRRFVPERARHEVGAEGSPVTVQYREPGSIRVAGSLDDETGTRLAPGVRFTLASSRRPDLVLEDRTTTRIHPVVVFDDLLPGSYLVRVDPETVAGYPPLQLLRPKDGMYQVSVEAGETADLTSAFVFQREAASITGEVRSALDGSPLVGLQVELRDPDADQPAGIGLTDEDGRYRFAGVEPGLWLIRAAQPAIDESGMQWLPRPPDAGEQKVVARAGKEIEARAMPLDPAPGVVTGWVQDAAGAGISGVEVVLEAEDGRTPARSRLSDARGAFAFTSVGTGSYIVRLGQPVEVAGQRYAPLSGEADRFEVQVASGVVTAVEPFRIQPIGAVMGRVRNDTDGAGIPGVRVELHASGQTQRETTDGRGIFIFRPVSPGLQVVSLVRPITADGTNWRPVPPDSGQRSVSVHTGAAHHVPDIVLERVAVPGTITGVVRIEEDGSGLAGVQLVVRPAAGGPRQAATRTDPGGAFTVDVPAGTWAIELSPNPVQARGQHWAPRDPDRGLRIVKVAAGGRAQADPLVVQPVAAPVGITGQVLDANTLAGLEDVRLRLRLATGGGERFALTDAHGQFAFTNVGPGEHVVELEQIPFELGPQRWEPVAGDDGARRVIVRAATEGAEDPEPPGPLEPLLVQPEGHQIFGTVTGPDDAPVPFLPVRILDGHGQQVGFVETNLDGQYEANVQETGRYIVEFEQDGTPTRRTVTVASRTQLNQKLGFIGGPPVQSTADFAAFPVLTESVALPQLPAPSGAPPSSVGQTVQGALREALGWRPRQNDPRGFTAALTQSFDRRLVEGHTEAVWLQRSYATQIQTDLGAITGAQASVYARAKVALDAALPLLDGLYPLDPAADPQDTEAIRTIVRSELTELVSELGVEGGPRLSRVDDLLDLLLHRQRATGHGTTVQGQLELLQDRFGLVATRVETVAEEEDVTNFDILRAYVQEIEASWNANRVFFDPTSGATPFLGTQLVLLSRSLSVVAESVTEVDFTLDSVFLGAAERLAVRLTFPTAGATLVDSQNLRVTVPGGTPSILLGELLSWVERVAAEEGPRLLQDGGKDGASALTPVLDRLRTLVRASLLTTGTGSNRGLQAPDSVPAGYATQRVQRALAELAKYLDDTAHLAEQIQR
jgi:Carboxypeptidase regulatory-like domain